MTIPRITTCTLSDLKISDKTTWRHVILKDQDGEVGLGEYTYDNQPDNIDDIARKATDHLRGKPIETASLKPLEPMLGTDFASASVYSAIEMALCDLQARRAGVPLHRFLTPQSTTGAVPLYANINRRVSPRTPEGFAQSVAHARSHGFDAFKIAPFDDLMPDLCNTPLGRGLIDAGMARISAAHAAGGDMAVMVDCHWRFDEKTALAILPDLASMGVTWFECPIAETVEHLEALKRIRTAANTFGMRLTGLETKTGWAAFQPYVATGCYDVIMPDVKHAGGLLATIEVARNAMAAGTTIALHNPSGPVCHQASVHVMLAAGSQERLEIQFDESPLFWSAAAPAAQIDQRQALVAPGAGIGIDLTY